jgi:ribonuclease R
MIQKEAVLNFIQQESYRPLSYNELIEALKIDEDNVVQFSKVLGKLEKEGEIVKTRKNKYGLPSMMNLVRGVVRLSHRGYGILVPDKVGEPEVFIYGKNINGAMHNDKVMVRIQHDGSDVFRPEGEVIRVIARANRELVGTLERGKHSMQVVPDDPRHIYPVYVKPSSKLKVKSGDKVIVRITSWPESHKLPEGKITEVIGKKGEPGLDVRVVIKKHGLRERFPEEVLEEAAQAAKPVTEKDIKERRDLRGVRMVTIDGEDAKDLDDAVSIRKLDQGYELGVHIADVSHYVKQNSKLDKEAFARGTSVYLIDKVLPMLPEALSNQVCSLNPKEDRLAVTCLMNIDDKGKVINYDIFESVINIDKRMTYTEVNSILSGGNQELEERYKELVPDFFLMKELAEILRKERNSRGALDFDFPESKVIVDEHSVPVEIKRLERGPGEMLIEDFMIKANETVAEHLHWQDMPALYRVHEKPDEDSLLKLNRVLGVFGHKIMANHPEPKVYQKMLNKVKGRPEERLISLLALRSMKHARYYPSPLGHFGLASKYYCHFTSPIRRYPDLIIHRVLKASLKGDINGKLLQELQKKIHLYGDHSTAQEIRAEEAERELVDIKKAQYMKKFVGDIFTARISSIQTFGFFVELDNTVEGLVHISAIADDYYEFNERNFTLVGIHSGRKFSIGDQVRVQLVRVDIEEARIDFELVEEDP